MDYICQQCRRPFSLPYPRSNRRPPPRFCSQRCNGNHRRIDPALRKNPYEQTRIEGVREFVHRIVFLDAHGPGPHVCHWCGDLVIAQPGRRTKRGALTIDHLDGNPQNNALANLVPSCHRCNCTRTQPPPKPIAAFTCAFCGATFYRVNQHRRDRPIRFCSRSCRFQGSGH